jgi:membrane protein
MASSGRVSGAAAAGRVRAQPLLAWADGSLLGRLWRRLLEMEFVERSIALAAKAFVSLLPLLIVVAAFVPEALRAGLVDSLVSRFGLSGEALDYVLTAFATPDEIRASTSILGLLLTVLFAVSFTTATQRVFLRAWRRPAQGALRDKQRGTLWLAGAVVFLTSVGSVARVLTGLPGTVTALVVGIVGSTLLWWWSAHTFLRGHVRWRALLPTALVSGIGSAVYAGAAAIWMPKVLEGNVEQFGFVGVGMSFVTWFVGFSFLLVASAALGPCLAEGDGAVARWLRGPDDDVLAPGAPPALPGPATTPSLLDYLRRGETADPDEA